MRRSGGKKKLSQQGGQHFRWVVFINQLPGMSQESVLGRQASKNKFTEDTVMARQESVDPKPGSSSAVRTGLIPRREFGPAANPRPPLLRHARGSWLTRPSEDKPSENDSKSLLSVTSKSVRRHSAPPVSSHSCQTFNLKTVLTISELLDAGTINKVALKLVLKKKVRYFIFYLFLLVITQMKREVAKILFSFLLPDFVNENVCH